MTSAGGNRVKKSFMDSIDNRNERTMRYRFWTGPHSSSYFDNGFPMVNNNRGLYSMHRESKGDSINRGKLLDSDGFKEPTRDGVKQQRIWNPFAIVFLPLRRCRRNLHMDHSYSLYWRCCVLLLKRGTVNWFADLLLFVVVCCSFSVRSVYF